MDLTTSTCSQLVRGMMLIVLIILVSILPAETAYAQNIDPRFQSMRDHFYSGEFGMVLQDYDKLPADLRSRPMPCFWTGQSYLRRHDFQSAEPLLRTALSGQLGDRQKGVAEDAVRRIAILKSFCPPILNQYKLDRYTITIYARPTPWSKLLAGQMPTFLQRAKEAFGNDSAHINFYLFEERIPYDKFFGAWTVHSGEVENHRGTGGVNLVMFCQYFPNGTKVGALDQNDLFARVLHEYSHALCHTIYGDNWGRDVPQWLNEGMADLFGWKYKSGAIEDIKKQLRQLATREQPPTYEVESRHLYTEKYFGYRLGDIMVDDLFDGKDISFFGKVISTARVSGGNFESAFVQLTGKDPRIGYEELVRKYWHE